MTSNTPATHRAWRIHAHGGSDQLRLDTLPTPEPGEGEVRIRVRAFGLNRSDLLWMNAVMFQPVLPSLVGYEICGIVEKLGKGVTRLAVGDRVSNVAGGYSSFGEYAVLPESALYKTPDNLSDVEGAAFTASHMTNYCGLVEFAEVRPWQHVLITAATSSNGLSAIAFARKAGATVIATTRRKERTAMLIEAGAHHAIATQDEDLATRVAEITGGKGCEVIYDCVGGQLTPHLLKSIATCGHWIQYGLLDPTPVQVSWAEWFFRQPKLSFWSYTQYSGGWIGEQMGLKGRPEALDRALRNVFQGVAERSLPIPIAKEFVGIESLPEAFRAMEADLGGGKIAVRL